MRPQPDPREVHRSTRFELFEERLALSAQPVGALFPEIDAGAPLLEPHRDTAPLEAAPDRGDIHIETRLSPPGQGRSGELAPALAETHPWTGVEYVHNTYGFDGAGQTVAIIDSGIAYDHEALGAGIGSGYRIVGGWDFAENDANPYDDGPWGFHGTHVAGIVGSDDATFTGVASGVDLVGLRVFDDDGAGHFQWVEQALQWVHQNRDRFDNPITTVNLSLGTEWNSDDVPEWTMLEDEFQQLADEGIFIAVSAGNSFAEFQQPGLSYPASSPFVVPVASVDDDGTLSSFSQRHERALAAPGRSITSTVPDHVFGADGLVNDFGAASGTSMAAPYVAGASTLVRQAMEFVGLQDVNEQVIYDHFRETADIFFDPATQSSYYRLNVQSALDALMPADDFASSAGQAHHLGSLKDHVQISGLIGTLDDRDFFTFTAASSGTATVAVTDQGPLAAEVALVGSSLDDDPGSGSHVTVSPDPSDPNHLSFDVLAGESYTVRLQSGQGLGRYDLDVHLETAAIDLGVIDFLRLDDRSVDGSATWQVSAANTGIFTAEALAEPGQGPIRLQVFDRHDRSLTSGVTSSVDGRVDVPVFAGETYHVVVSGNSDDVDLRFTNLVSRQGDQLHVFGTSGRDEVVLRATDFDLDVNGVRYEGGRFRGIRSVTIDTAGGDDTVTVHATNDDESAYLGIGVLKLNGRDYTVETANAETAFLFGGGGHDSARLDDSTGNDRFVGREERSWMVGAGFLNQVEDFEEVFAFADGGGFDTALLYDSAGDDRFVGRQQRSWIVGTNRLDQVEGFDQTVAYSTAGGDDTALLYGSSGDDRFVGQAHRSWLAGSGFLNQAEGFGAVVAYAGSGGNDTARLEDSTGDDRFVGERGRSWMAGPGFLNQAEGFDRVFAYSHSGHDVASLHDSAGDDRFVGRSQRSWMTGRGVLNQVEGFATTYAFADAGGKDTALFYDSAGDDRFVGQPGRSWMVGAGYRNEAHGFQRVQAFASAGGFDTATLYDSSQDDTYYSRDGEAILAGSGFYNFTRGFRHTQVHSRAGGHDVAIFEELGSADRMLGRDHIAIAEKPGSEHVAYGFAAVRAESKSGEAPSSDVGAVDYLFEQLGDWQSGEWQSGDRDK